MSSGVFGVSRDIFEHPMFVRKREFSRLEAWLWLVAEAAWKSYEKRAGGKTMTLKRGQLCASIRFMAEAWCWHRAKVERFIHELKTEAMIETSIVAGQTVISICNYNEYQKVSLPSKTDGETLSETAARQQRDSSETNEKEGKEGKEGNIPLRGPEAVSGKSLEAEAYRYGKSVLGKSAGGVISDLRRACDYDDAYALEWLRRAAEKHDPMEWLQAVLKSSEWRHLRGLSNVVKSDIPVIEGKEDRDYQRWAREYYRTVDYAAPTPEEAAEWQRKGLA